MKEFCAVLGNVIGRPSWLRVPGFVLKIVLGEMADMLLNGQRVIPKKILDAGFEFQFPALRETLKEIFQRKNIC
jgi:NAD dependent epimerase/dehydratase family enzyme